MPHRRQNESARVPGQPSPGDFPSFRIANARLRGPGEGASAARGKA